MAHPFSPTHLVVARPLKKELILRLPLFLKQILELFNV